MIKKIFNWRNIVILLLAFILFIPSVQAESRVITDMSGRKVELPVQINRIVTTYVPATQFVFALGAEDKLVGIDVGSPRMQMELLSTLKPDFKGLPAVGGLKSGINLEEIIALNPDLVVLFPYREAPVIADKLQQQGISSLIIKPESFKLIRETNLLLGKTLNLEKEAAIIDKQFAKILTLINRSGNIPQTEKRKVYFANSTLFNTVGEGMLQTDMIQLAGGFNPARDVKSGFIESSPEQLIIWNPDIIITSHFFSGNDEQLLIEPRYQSVKAFVSDSIYRFPSNLEPWDFPSPACYPGVLWLSEKIYPERYEDVSIKEIINNFYESIYGKSYEELGGEFPL